MKPGILISKGLYRDCALGALIRESAGTDPIRTLRRVRDHRVLRGDVPRSVQTRSVLEKQGRRAERKARDMHTKHWGRNNRCCAEKNKTFAHLDRMLC